MSVQYVNVRGSNGSGKTHLLRSMLDDAVATVTQVFVPDHKPIDVTLVQRPGQGLLALVGNYTKLGCVGLDKVRTQAAAKEAIEAAGRLAGVRSVLFEGVLVATIFGPWLAWSKKVGGMTWAFLDTPLAECLRRIQVRNGGKEIDEELVRDKHRGIRRVQQKAEAAGEHVVTLPWEGAQERLSALLRGEL